MRNQSEDAWITQKAEEESGATVLAGSVKKMTVITKVWFENGAELSYPTECDDPEEWEGTVYDVKFEGDCGEVISVGEYLMQGLDHELSGLFNVFGDVVAVQYTKT